MCDRTASLHSTIIEYNIIHKIYKKKLKKFSNDKSVRNFLLIISFKNANFVIINIIIYERKGLFNIYKLVKTFRREYKL